MLLEEPMSDDSKTPTEKKYIVNPKAEFKKHPSSETQEVVKIVIPQSFRDYLKKLDDDMKAMVEKNRRKNE